MAEEHVKTFFKKLEEDENLGERYKSLLQGMATPDVDEENLLKEVVEFASQNGYEFASEDVKLVIKSMQDEELSDEELDAVAGGGFGVMFVGGFETGTGKDHPPAVVCYGPGYTQ